MLKNALFLLPLVVAGCAATDTGLPEAQRQIAESLGTGEAITLLATGESVDAVEVPSKLLSFRRAVQLTVTHDARIQMALARVRAAEADAQQARLLPNPVLSISLKFPENGGKPKIEGSLAADLLAVLQMPRRNSAADNRLRVSSANALGTALDAVTELQEHYTNIQALRAQAIVLADRRNLLDNLLSIAQARVAAGEAPQLEATTIQAQQLALTQEIARRVADERDERLILARLVGSPSNEADWDLDPWQSPTLTVTGERQWIETAIRQRPDLQAARWELAALGDDVALAGFIPFAGSDVGAVTERDSEWMTGPSLTTPLPLFDWGQASRGKAIANQIDARHKLVQTLREAVEDIRRSYAAFTAARATAETAQSELIPLQEQRRQQAEDAYKAGETNFTTLLVAEQELQQARSDLIDLQQKMTVSLYRLERAVGGPAVSGRLETTPSAAPASQIGPTAPLNSATRQAPASSQPATTQRGTP